ncbi:MAG: energy-coupling factor ABC transporter permease [Coriobacteriia bacterium]
MHMSDALVSPAVGTMMWTVAAATTVYCAKKVRDDLDENKVPLMGVVGAFVFAAQMLNFQIPGTGSSGHIGGALLLAVMLGPHAAFLVIASVLTVQALFFADGGLLALGANMFNLGFLPAFVAYPLVYRAINGNGSSGQRMIASSVLGAMAAMLLGAVAMVAETTASGISELPASGFLIMMLPIHAAIGLLEGLITAAVLRFVRRAQPDILITSRTGPPPRPAAPVLAAFLIAAMVAGTALTWFTSANPDGLEWAISNVAGVSDIVGASGSRVHRASAEIQRMTAVLPEYGLPSSGPESESPPEGESVGASLSGALGIGLVMSLTIVGSLALKRHARKRGERAPEPDALG